MSPNFRFTWTRVGVAASEGKITWDVPKTEVPGLYRIGHFGHYKPITSEGPRAFKGQSREFRDAGIKTFHERSTVKIGYYTQYGL